MNLKQKAEAFWAEFEKRTRTRLVGANGPDRVEVYQKLAGLEPDKDAGPKTFGHMREKFPEKGETMTDGFPDAPLVSVEKDGFFPVADDDDPGVLRRARRLYRVTDGFKWSRTYHFAQDITRRMPSGVEMPNSDGHFGAPKGSRVLACLTGVVVDIDMRGRYYSITLKHNTVEFGVCYSYYLHIDGPAPGIRLGQIVHGGDFIAWNGISGTDLRHLHWSFHIASTVDTPWRADSWNWLQHTAVNLGGKDWDHHDGGWLGKWKRIFIAL